MISVENIIIIYTIVDGKINLLTNDGSLIKFNCDDEIDEVNKNYINENLNIKDLNLKQCFTFSKKEKDNLKFSILFIDIVNIDNIKGLKNFKLIPLEELDKDDNFLCKSIEYLKKEIVLYSRVKRLYPNEFILPELQKFYEEILNKKFDRRNFRKKLLKLDIIECLEQINSNKTGRPAKLYKFKDIKEDKILF